MGLFKIDHNDLKFNTAQGSLSYHARILWIRYYSWHTNLRGYHWKSNHEIKNCINVCQHIHILNIAEDPWIYTIFPNFLKPWKLVSMNLNGILFGIDTGEINKHFKHWSVYTVFWFIQDSLCTAFTVYQCNHGDSS